MSAIEIVKNGDAARPDAGKTKAIAAAALEKGVLLLTCGVRANVIRFLPALTIGDDLLDEALSVVGEVIGEL
jgi:4-aminobutyrate aminotransferase/(S)-3-amino-2-methylpropionate transaminase